MDFIHPLILTSILFLISTVPHSSHMHQKAENSINKLNTFFKKTFITDFDDFGTQPKGGVFGYGYKRGNIFTSYEQLILIAQQGKINDFEKYTHFIKSLNNSKEHSKITRLHFWAVFGHALDEAFIHNNRDDINTTDFYGLPPLFYAVLSGNVHTVKILLTCGANPNYEINRITALKLASQHLTILNELIKYGAFDDDIE